MTASTEQPGSRIPDEFTGAFSGLMRPPSLCVGLAGWQGRLTTDTEAGRAHLARLYAVSLLPDSGGALTTVHVGLAEGVSPRLRFSANGCPGDFSPLFNGPEGRRFVPVPHVSRRFYADTAMGDSGAILELCGDTLHVLRPALWPVYLLHILTWRMLCERPVAVLHAGVCAAAGLALVVVGPSGCGKSTLCWALMQQGADFFSDECAVFDLTEHRLYVWPHRASLRPGGVARLTRPPDVSQWHETKPNDPKCVPDLRAPRVPCPSRHVLVFVMGFGDQPALMPLPGGEAAWRLARVMACGEPSPLARLEIAADLVSRSQCLALTLGGPEETAKILIAYAESAGREPA